MVGYLSGGGGTRGAIATQAFVLRGGSDWQSSWLRPRVALTKRNKREAETNATMAKANQWEFDLKRGLVYKLNEKQAKDALRAIEQMIESAQVKAKPVATDPELMTD